MDVRSRQKSINIGAEEFAICISALVYRLISCFLVQTWFVPDEYYQSLEPGHRWAFGYGQLTWEWREHGLRSYIHPLLIGLLYSILQFFSIDYAILLINIPRILQSVLAALGDIYLYKWTKLITSGNREWAFWTLFAYWSSWFSFFAMSRTLSNSTETSLMLIAFYYYPCWNGVNDQTNTDAQRKISIYLALASISVILRPTAALFWAPLCFWNLIRVKNDDRVKFIFNLCLPVVGTIFLISLFIDRLCYGRWTIPLWNFAYFNVFSGGSSHFGVHPWHWYLTIGLPSCLTVHLILAIHGLIIIKSAENLRSIFYISVWYIAFHSLLAHKEQRFLLPIVPLFCFYAGNSLRYMNLKIPNDPDMKIDDKKRLKIDDKKRQFHMTYEFNIKSCLQSLKFASKNLKIASGCLLLVNLPVALYTGLVHQRGPLDVMRFLHRDIQSRNAENLEKLRQNLSVWFLTPCHSTPLYSHMHLNMPLRTLSCEPNFDHLPNYMDEADLFHENPNEWIKNEFSHGGNYSIKMKNNNSNTPSHLVLYENMWFQLKSDLEILGNYHLIGRIFNAHFLQGDRQSRYFVVVSNI